MDHKCCTCLLLFLLLSMACNIWAMAPTIIVFGDSTADAGNNNQFPTLAKSNFGPYGRDFEGGKPTGRFCNGRLFTDFISESFGIKSTIPAYLDPSYSIEDFATGVTFASAGSGYDSVTSSQLSVIPLDTELEYFKEYQGNLMSLLGNSRAKTLFSEALYIISIGTNDFIENYYIIPDRSFHFTVEEYQEFILGIAEKFILKIYQLGARKISITGLPPMGCLPYVRTENFLLGHACREDYNKDARDYNVKLQTLIAKLTIDLKDIKLVYLDTYNPIKEAIEKPNIFGLEEVVTGCCATGTFELGPLCNSLSKHTCVDASKYAFWDAVHPSEKLYQIIAESLMTKNLIELK